MIEQVSSDTKALLAQLHAAPAVPGGWDAALTLSRPAVEALILSDWNTSRDVQADHSLFWIAPADVEGRYEVVEVQTELPTPAIGLNVDSQTMRLGFKIESGSLQFANLSADEVAHVREAGGLGAARGAIPSVVTPITPQNPLRLEGTAGFEVSTAEDRASISIGLNLATATLTLSGSGNEAFSSQASAQTLAHWLAAHKQAFRIASLTTGSEAEAGSLSVATVAVRIVTSTAGEEVLQILTSSLPGVVTSSSLSGVIHPDGQDFSLLVSSQAAVTVLANAYNLGRGAIKLAAVPPEDDRVHWSALVHEPMVFEGIFGNQDGEVYVKDHARLYMGFGGSDGGELKLFTFTDPASTIQLQLKLAADFPLGIDGLGADQTIDVDQGSQSVTATGFYEAIVQPQLERFLTEDIKTDMTQVRMTAISDFLLRDLVLSGHRPVLTLVALPGELLVAGSLALRG